MVTLNLMDQGRVWPKLKTLNLNHIKHKLLRSNASTLIQKWESILTWKTKEDDEEAVDCDTSGVQTPIAALLPSISRTGRLTTTSRLLTTWMSLSPTLYARPLSQRGTNRLLHRLVLHSEKEPSPWPGFSTFLREKRLRQAYGGLLLRLCQRPVSLGGTTSLRPWRKENCETQTSWHYLEAELNTCAKIWVEFPTHLTQHCQECHDS